LAYAKAASSQRRSAPVRWEMSSSCAWLLVGVPYQVSSSLFEPPGMLTVTKTTSLVCQRTFSTKARSVGKRRSYAVAREVTRSVPEPRVRPGLVKNVDRTKFRLSAGLPFA
jgi:hypothetical protein